MQGDLTAYIDSIGDAITTEYVSLSTANALVCLVKVRLYNWPKQQSSQVELSNHYVALCASTNRLTG